MKPFKTCLCLALAAAFVFCAAACDGGNEKENPVTVIEEGYSRLDVKLSNGRKTEGFGTQFDTCIVEKQNGLNDADWKVQIDALEKMQLQSVRIRFYPEMYERGNDNNDPESFDYYLIEVNPRVSRSSALASKASGYPIARVTAKVAVGLHLDEIRLATTPASFEPAIDYVVTKIARFPFDKFAGASNKLSTQMKATGEVMSIGRTIEESLLKAVRSLEVGVCHIYHPKFDKILRLL